MKIKRGRYSGTQSKSFPIVSFVLVVILLMLLSSCVTLQKQKGYENYKQNTEWAIISVG